MAEVHHARFLLQQRALHLYFLPLSGHPPALIAAPTPADRDVLCGAVFAGVPNATFYDRRRTVAAAASAAKRWASGDMSNFDYLMLLNTLAGRSYCDLAQYPVFPWVVQDWYSECLDLADPASFRDLSKPIGALNEDRLERFHERYNSLLQDESVAPFFYGTHYSSAGIVLWYLLRMEPFTALARSLQVRPGLPAALSCLRGCACCVDVRNTALDCSAWLFAMMLCHAVARALVARPLPARLKCSFSVLRITLPACMSVSR